MEKTYDKTRIFIKSVLCIVLIITLFTSVYRNAGFHTKSINIVKSKLIVEFIDVGHGDATFVKLNNFAMLIDTGDMHHYNTVDKTLKKYNVKKLNYLFLTNNNNEDIGAANKIIKKYNPKNILASATITNLKTNKKIKYPDAGYMFNHNLLKVRIVTPMKNKITSNNNEILPMMLRFDYGGSGFFICSDAGIDKYVDIKNKDTKETFQNVDVLLVENHGKIGGLNNERIAMDMFNPDYAVVSSDTYKFNKLNKAFKSLNMKALYTKREGNITFSSDGKNITLLNKK